MNKKIELTDREYELLNRTKELLSRKKEVTKPIVAGNFKKTKEELSKNPTLQNFFKKFGIKIKF
jgi:hypothetical protein